MQLLPQTDGEIKNTGWRSYTVVPPGHVEAAAAWWSGGVRSMTFLSLSLSLFVGLQKVKMEESCCAWSAWRPSLILCSLSPLMFLSPHGKQRCKACERLVWECWDWRWRDARQRNLGVMEVCGPNCLWLHSLSTVQDWPIMTISEMIWKLRPFSYFLSCNLNQWWL